MNAAEARESGENRTRRRMLATAGGLLLPAGLRAADADEAPAQAKEQRQGKRQPPRPELRYWANDTVVNLRNATNDKVRVLKNNWSHLGGRPYYLDPGKELGYYQGIDHESLMTDTWMYIGFGESWHFKLYFETNEIGTPDATIYWKYGPGTWDWGDISGERDMEPNTTFEYIHYDHDFNNRYGTPRFHVHRWADGKEPLDEYEEWYTRFFVSLSMV